MSEVENVSKPKRGKVRRSRTNYTAYRASGKSQQQYATEVGVKYQTFVNWVHLDNRKTSMPWWTRLWAWVTRS